MRIFADVVQGTRAPLRLEIDAATLEDARQIAVRQGYDVLHLRAARFEDLASSLLAGASLARQPRFDLLVFVEQVRDLLLAGLSVIEALSTLGQDATPGTRLVVDSLVRRLTGGEQLSNAIALDPAFPALLVALVRASELTSDLPQALERFLDHERRVAELRHRITAVAIYPAMLVGVGACVLLFLLFYVMPRFARIFDGMQGDLPWSARAMVEWSHLLANHVSLLIAATAIFVVTLGAIAASAVARAHMLQRLLDWSPMRIRLRVYFLARWYRATGLLVEGGIPLPEALRLSQALLPSGLKAAGAQVELEVRNGHTPSQAHVRGGMATPVAEQLLRAGERSGDLGAVLKRVALFHEAELARALERGMRILEPLVMVLIGLGVGTVVVLMYLPIFELASAIQ